jgi:hypothetical protein
LARPPHRLHEPEFGASELVQSDLGLRLGPSQLGRPSSTGSIWSAAVGRRSSLLV